MPFGLTRLIPTRVARGAGTASADTAGTTYTVSGLKVGSSAILYGNGTQIATATVDGTGKATWSLGSKPAVGTIITYDGVVVGSGGTVTAPPVAPSVLSISGANGTANVGDTLSFTPTISGGTTPYNVTATGLAQGRAIQSATTGLTTGAYTTAGSYSETYTVTDAAGATASFTRSVVVAAAASTVQLQKWKDALATLNAGTRSIRLVGMGPGHMAGTTATMAGAHQTSPLAKVGDSYVSSGFKVNTCSFFGNQNASATNPYTASSSTSFDSRITMSGVALVGPSNKSFGQFGFNFTKSGDTISLTKEDAVDSLNAFFKRASDVNGVLNVVANGNVVGTISANGVNGVASQVITFPKAVQTVSLQWVSGAVIMIGGMVFDSTAREIQIFNIGISDAAILDMTFGDNNVSIINNLAVLAPDLTIVEQSQADTTSLTEMQLFRGGYGRLFSWLKGIGSDVLAMTTHPWDLNLTNMGSTNQQKYVDWFSGTATNLAIPVADLYAYLGTYSAENTAGRQANVRQRNAAGFAYDATFIRNAINTAISTAALSYPAAQTYDISDAATLRTTWPTPGSTVRLLRGVSYAGPFNIGFTGASDAPITITTTGPTTGPAIITGTPQTDPTNPNFVDAITVYGSNMTFDGTVIDNQKLGLWVKDTGRFAFARVEGTLNVNVKYAEWSNTGSGLLHKGRKGKYIGNYSHDMNMVRNDYAITSPKNDNDYGANSFIISGSDFEIAWCRNARGIAKSFDYGTDGGFLELFPLYGEIARGYIHDNYIELGDGVIESGGITGTGTVITDIDFTGNICLNNFGVAALHNQGGGFEAAHKNFKFRFNNIAEEFNVLSTRASVFLDGTTKLEGFQIPNYGFNDNIFVLNNGISVFKQNDATYHKGNVFFLANKDPANTGSGTDGSKTHLYTDYGMTLGSGEAYLPSNPFVDLANRNFAIVNGSAAAGKGRDGWTPVPVLGVSAWPADYNPAPARSNTTTTLTTSNATPTTGSSVTLTATMNATSVTGMVVFYDGSTEIGRSNLSSGAASVSVTLAEGAHANVRAAYYGDATNNISLSNAVSITVSASSATATTTNLAASNTTPASGTPITLTATVSPNAATGTVTFKDGTTTIGTATLSSGTATLSNVTLASGSHSLTASYPGDANYAASTSNTVTVTVAAAPPPSSGTFDSNTTTFDSATTTFDKAA